MTEILIINNQQKYFIVVKITEMLKKKMGLKCKQNKELLDHLLFIRFINVVFVL